MLQHLTNAAPGTVEALTAESGVSWLYEVCDNIQLISTLQEWEEYYELKFAASPRLSKSSRSTRKASTGLAPWLPRV